MKKNSKTLLYILLAVLVICSLCYCAKDTTEHLGFPSDRWQNHFRRLRSRHNNTHWCDLPGNSQYCTKNWTINSWQDLRTPNNGGGFCNSGKWIGGMSKWIADMNQIDKTPQKWQYEKINDNRNGWQCILSAKPWYYGDQSLTNPHAEYSKHINSPGPTWRASNNCIKTNKTKNEGGICLDERQNQIRARDSVRKCCSGHGLRNGYRWVDKDDNKPKHKPFGRPFGLG